MSQVSLIMRSKNERPFIDHALRALEGQTFQDFQLYNIDSSSKDGSWEVVQRYNPTESAWQIPAEEYDPGSVLNSGVERAKSPLIVFLNADAIPLHREWLENLLCPLLEDRADAVTARQVARQDAYWIVQEDYARTYDPDRRGGREVDLFSAVSCAFKREVWEEEPFYEGGYSEDAAWFWYHKQRGKRFVFAYDAVVEHSHNYTFSELYERGYVRGEPCGRFGGAEPNFASFLLRFGKEAVRDFLFACREKRPHTLPYNLLYRGCLNYGLYRGTVEGTKKRQGRSWSAPEWVER